MKLTPIGNNPTEEESGYMRGCKFVVGLVIAAALLILVAWAQGQDHSGIYSAKTCLMNASYGDKQPVHVIPHDPKYTTFDIDDLTIDVICENHVSPAVELTGRMATISCDPQKEGTVRRYGPKEDPGGQVN